MSFLEKISRFLLYDRSFQFCSEIVDQRRLAVSSKDHLSSHCGGCLATEEPLIKKGIVTTIENSQQQRTKTEELCVTLSKRFE